MTRFLRGGLFLILFPLIAVAELPDDGLWFTPADNKYYSRVFRINDGLPQSTATSMIQSSDGYLWMTTFGGLIRYDGHKFKIYTTGTYPELLNNRLTAIHQDKYDIIWIGSEDGDVIKYENGRFSAVFKGRENDNLKPIHTFYHDSFDNLWFGGDAGLRLIKNVSKNNSITTEALTLLDHSIKYIEPLSLNGLLVLTEKGAFNFNSDNIENFSKIISLGDHKFNSAIADNDNSVWVAGIQTIHNLVDGNIAASIDLENASIQAANKTAQGDLLFVSGQSIYRLRKGKLHKIPHIIVTNQNVASVLEDNEGNIWIGSDVGLEKYTRRNIWSYLQVAAKTVRSVSSIIEVPNNNIFIASGYDILLWDRSELKLEFSLKTTPNAKDGEIIRSMAVSPDGTLLFATNHALWEYKDNKVAMLPRVSDFHSEIGVIFFDRRGNKWLGSKLSGLQFTSPAGKTVFNVANGLINNSIVRLRENRDGSVFVSTRGGLSVIKDGKVLRSFTIDEGLGSNHVRDTFEDDFGSIWIGTYGGGISRLKDGNIVTLNTKQGLPEDVSSAFLHDQFGNLWVMGNQGIYSLNIKELNEVADGNRQFVSSVVYNHQDDIINPEGNGGNDPAAWKDTDGNLWFATIEGAISIDPTIHHKNDPTLHIEQILLDGVELPVQDSIVVSSGFNSLEIDFTGITFTKPEYLTFQYKLEGLDKEWNYIGTRRTAYFQFLPPGEYIFKVRTASAAGSEENTAMFKLTVQASFFQSWYGLMLILLLLVSVLAIVFQIRYTRLENKRQRQTEFARQLLSAQESERQRIAADLHDSLGNDLLVIKNWAKIALSTLDSPEETKSKLKEIYSVTSNVIEETRSISRNLRPHHLHRFGLTSTIKNLIETMNSISETSIRYQIQDIDNIFNTEDELNIFRIIQEGLNNIVKHSQAHNAKILIKNRNRTIEIDITDDGIGFEQYSLLNSMSGRKRHFSFGLESIHHRVESLDGSYNIDSAPKKGTRIKIILNKSGS